MVFSCVLALLHLTVAEVALLRILVHFDGLIALGRVPPLIGSFLVAPLCCTHRARSGIGAVERNHRPALGIAPASSRHGRPVPLLLPEFRRPRPRQARRRKPDRDQPLRARQEPPYAPVPEL